MLPKSYQHLISRYIRLRVAPWVVLSDVGTISDTFTHTIGDDKRDDDTASSGSLSTFSDPTPAQAATFTKSQIQARNNKETHASYMRYLQRNQPAKPPMERFGAGYQDYLQSPLQPLADNLESITYEVFEKDPVKYEWYERAIAAALKDWVAQDKPGSGPQGKITVAVVGAGRGPLVTRALQASQATGIEIDMWALEKNPNAFVLLQHHNNGKWNQRVNLVHSDMRSWKGPSMVVEPRPGTPDSEDSLADFEDDAPRKEHYTVDIIVSELLGSFADNELSPECLDGVQHVLNPVYGISIPTSYSAHLTPIAAPKIHADIMSRSAAGDPDATQIPYVVLLQAIDYLSYQGPPGNVAIGSSPPPEWLPDVQQAWEFTHPLTLPFLHRVAENNDASGNVHNNREAHLSFRCQSRGACHGLAGYFETVLYSPASGGAVELSTNPLTIDEKSKNMISWFPIYFPLKVNTVIRVPRCC